MFVLIETELVNLDNVDCAKLSGKKIYFFYNDGHTEVEYSDSATAQQQYQEVLKGILEGSKIVELKEGLSDDSGTGGNESDEIEFSTRMKELLR